MRGRLIVLSGPSGVGKTTVGKALLRRCRRLARSVSATTRPPRPGERNGKDYRFLSGEAFRDMLKRGGFLEHAVVHGRLYGTPKGPVEQALRRGKDVLLVIDVQGARQLRRSAPGAVSIFLMPPGWKVLKERLGKRGSEDHDSLKVRLATARRELAQRRFYGHVLVNDRLADTVRAVCRILGIRR